MSVAEKKRNGYSDPGEDAVCNEGFLVPVCLHVWDISANAMFAGGDCASRLSGGS